MKIGLLGLDRVHSILGQIRFIYFSSGWDTASGHSSLVLHAAGLSSLSTDSIKLWTICTRRRMSVLAGQWPLHIQQDITCTQSQPDSKMELSLYHSLCPRLLDHFGNCPVPNVWMKISNQNSTYHSSFLRSKLSKSERSVLKIFVFCSTNILQYGTLMHRLYDSFHLLFEMQIIEKKMQRFTHYMNCIPY